MGNFDCIGFQADSAADLAALVEQTLPAATHVGTGPQGAETFRWEDSSGARVIFEKRGQNVHNMLPSFAGQPSVTLVNVVRLNDDTSAADVVDESGELITRLAVDLEQRALIARQTARGRACLTAFVGEATFHKDAEAFARSPASLIGDPAEFTGDPPAHFREQGWPWPPRMGAQSIMSQGLFGSPKDARPIAVLNGLVVAADVRTNSITRRLYLHVRLDVIGFELDVCMPVDDAADLPRPGQVMATTSYVIGSLEEWAAEEVKPKDAGLFGRLRNLGR